MTFWKFIAQHLKRDIPVAILKVVDSSGSSPGRQGFQMAVAATNEMHGSIGGGIMEHKLVELAVFRLQQTQIAPLLMEQIHNKESEGRQSGMICSGEQHVAIYQLYKMDTFIDNILSAVKEGKVGYVIWNHKSIRFETGTAFHPEASFSKVAAQVWNLAESTKKPEVVHLIGGGHVGLALSKLLKQLGFSVILYDDREGLNTIAKNNYADETHIVNYENLNQILAPDPLAYIVIMTFGYRTDKIVLRQLLMKKFKYIGMLGSRAKIEKLWEEFEAEGVTAVQLVHIHAPIGLPIHSQTPEEIAVSIAAEMIKVKNGKG